MTKPNESGAEPAGGQRLGMPRWVIGFIVGGLILVALVVLLLALGHGPGRHMPAHTGMPAGSASPLARS